MSEQSDAEFFKVFTWVLVGLGAIGALAIIIAIQVIDASGLKENNPLYAEDVVNERIAPVGTVRMQGDAEITAEANVVEVEQVVVPRGGAEVVAGFCAGCHQGAIQNAPKIGDNAAWVSRMGAGPDALIASAIQGKGGMPPKGGCVNCSDEEIRKAVLDMLENSGIEIADAAANN